MGKADSLARLALAERMRGEEKRRTGRAVV
jgi:hypothetical protein